MILNELMAESTHLGEACWQASYLKKKFDQKANQYFDY